MQTKIHQVLTTDLKGNLSSYMRPGLNAYLGVNLEADLNAD